MKIPFWFLLIIICNFFIPFSMAQSGKRWINMNWNTIKGASSYQFELFQKTGIKFKSIKIYTVQSNNWSHRLNPGTYKFRIRSLDHRKVPGKWSDQTDLIVKNLKQEISRKKVSMEWKQIKLASSYQLELFLIDGIKKFSRGIFKTNLPEWSYMLEPGKYEFRIRSLDVRNVPGKWSLGTRFTVDLPTPDIFEPANLETIYSNKKGKISVPFRWQKVSQAKNYYLEVWEKGDGTIFADKITKNYKKLNLYVDKFYQWRIVALGKKEKLIPVRANVHNFNIKFDKFFRPEKIEPPPPPGRWGISASTGILSLSYKGFDEKNGKTVNDDISGAQFLLGGIYQSGDQKFNLAIDLILENYKTKTEKDNLINILAYGNYIDKTVHTKSSLRSGIFKMDNIFIDAGQQTSIVSSTGLLIGFDVMYQTSNKWFLSGGGTLFCHLLDLSVPNGEAMKFSTSKIVNLWGGRFFGNDFTVKIGYSWRTFNVSFDSETEIDYSEENTDAIKKNDSKVTGHTIHLNVSNLF